MTIQKNGYWLHGKSLPLHPCQPDVLDNPFVYNKLKIEKIVEEVIMLKLNFRTRQIIFFLLILLPCFVYSCRKNNDLAPEMMKVAEGTWYGDFADDKIVFTIIEGEFEGSVTITGTAFLQSDTSSSAYQIMNGSRNVQSLLFSLYKIPLAAKEDYHVRGEIKNQFFSGTFDRLNSKGEIIQFGTFHVERIP